MRRRVPLAVLAVLVSCSACTADVIDGRGAGPAASASSDAAPTGSASKAAAPKPTTAASVEPGLALLRSLRDNAGAPWVSLRDPRTSATFELPDTVTAETKIQNGISQRVYEYVLTKQSGVAVSFVRVASAAAASIALDQYPDQLRQAFVALGADDARVSERSNAMFRGKESVSFRFTFTPTSAPQIPPVWLVRATASGQNLMILQTVLFPPSVSYDYAPYIRLVHKRLEASARLP